MKYFRMSYKCQCTYLPSWYQIMHAFTSTPVQLIVLVMEHTLSLSNLSVSNGRIQSIIFTYNQSLPINFVHIPGTHHCWVERAGMEWEICPTLLFTTNSGNQPPDRLTMPYQLNHIHNQECTTSFQKLISWGLLGTDTIHMINKSQTRAWREITVSASLPLCITVHLSPRAHKHKGTLITPLACTST